MSACAAHEKPLFRTSICCLFVFLVLFLLSSTRSIWARGAPSQQTKRPVTVADAIRMTRWPWGELEFSPDSQKFILVLRKGNLENNTNEYSLLLWSTIQVFQSPPPEILLTMSSSSNRAAITDIKWLQDNETLMLLGENPGEFHQLYEFNIRTRVLRRLTNLATNIVSYSATPKGDQWAYVPEEPVTNIFDDKARREGVVVSSQYLFKLIAGQKGGDALFEGTNQLFFHSQTTDDRRIETRHKIFGGQPYLSPDGRYLVIQTLVDEVPQSWKEYADPLLHDWASQRLPKGESTWLNRYELVDTSTGTSRVLLDAPVRPQWGSEVAWSPDGRSVIISDTYLPLEGTSAEEREVRKTIPFTVETKVPDANFVKISAEDLRLLGWDAKSNRLVFLAGRLNWNLEPKVFFRRKGEMLWEKIADSQPQNPRPEILIEQDLNTPPKLFAVDPRTQERVLLLDLNPQFKDQTFAKEEEIHWKTSDGHDVKAGLYYPLNYAPGKRYPLVIQTHAFVPGQFWIDGPWTTAYAAQPLAAKSIMVLQMDEIDGHYNEETPQLIQREVFMIETAIDHLDEAGLVDRNHIGIIGFSVTCTDVAYALTHSKQHFAAASLTDGQDGGYFGYIAVSNAARFSGPFSEGVNGGSPFGEGLKLWKERSPGFNADKIKTPLRIVAPNPLALLSGWELFAALSRLNKPVEMIYMQDGSHILEKPWQRMVSQQGNVDWFCFWLKGEEDPDPDKAKQYARWRELRDGDQLH